MRRVLGAILVGMALVFIILSLVVPVTTYDTYNGKVVFTDEAGYSQFKTELGKQDVKYSPEDISVLSSAPPIVVNFRNIQVPSGHLFPYGDVTTNTPVVFYAALVILGLFGIVLLCAPEKWFD